jgi:hypothetical protein
MLVMSTSYNYAQNAINISFLQDFKLLAFGDELGNRAGTLNFIARIKYEAEDHKFGYFIYGLEYEKAFLSDYYSRYGAFTGYTFMDVFDNYNLHATPSVGIGLINRKQHNILSWSASLELEYFISNNLRISVLNQITERTDLKMLYDDLQYRYSFFIGLEVKLFDMKKD